MTTSGRGDDGGPRSRGTQHVAGRKHEAQQQYVAEPNQPAVERRPPTTAWMWVRVAFSWLIIPAIANLIWGYVKIRQVRGTSTKPTRYVVPMGLSVLVVVGLGILGAVVSQTGSGLKTLPRSEATSVGTAALQASPSVAKTSAPATVSAPTPLKTASFNWTDGQGYKYLLNVNIFAPSATASVPGCPGADAPPGAENIPFTIAVSNQLGDRSEGLPNITQEFTGLSTGSGAHIGQIIEGYGTTCDDSLVGITDQIQSASTLGPAQTVTISGVVLNITVPTTESMTFGDIVGGHFGDTNAVSTISVPLS